MAERRRVRPRSSDEEGTIVTAQRHGARQLTSSKVRANSMKCKLYKMGMTRLERMLPHADVSSPRKPFY